jgi:hypothetical protein
MPPITPLPEPIPRNDLAAPNSSTSPATIESILDVDRNGYLDRHTLLRGLYILGLDPSPRDLAPVLAELDMQHVSLTQGQYQSDHMVNSALDTMLEEAGITLNEVAELIDYYAVHNRCRREDGFVYLAKKTYFSLRLATMTIPLGGVLMMSFFLPRFTEHEISVHKIMKNIIGGFGAFQALVLPLTAISAAAGWTETLGKRDVLASALVNGLLCWGAQAWREATLLSATGAVTVDALLREKFLLRHTFFTAEDGSKISATATAARMITDADGVLRMGSAMSKIPHHRWSRMLKTRGKRRFSAAPDPSDPPTSDVEAQGGLSEAFLEHMLDAKKDDVDKKYNITRCGVLNAVPHVAALLRALLPQLFRIATRAPVVFSSTFTPWENTLEVLNMIFVAIFVDFALLVLFFDAMGETTVDYRLASHLHALIAKKSDTSMSASEASARADGGGTNK